MSILENGQRDCSNVFLMIMSITTFRNGLVTLWNLRVKDIGGFVTRVHRCGIRSLSQLCQYSPAIGTWRFVRVIMTILLLFAITYEVLLDLYQYCMIV